jgi:hypothetical protein
MHAKSAADAAVAMNRRIFTRFTGTPMLRDASFDPPTAKIQFPNLVRSRTHVATATTRIHQSSSTLKSAPPIVNRTELNSFESGSSAAAAPTPLTIVWPFETTLVNARPAPRSMYREPRVTMNDGRPVLTTM